MVTGLITGPDRIPNLGVKEALDMGGVYELHAPEETQTSEGTLRRIEEQRKRAPGVVYYPSGLATDRREGRLFSVAESMPDLQAESNVGEIALSHEGLSEDLPGVQLELIILERPTIEVSERLAA